MILARLLAKHRICSPGGTRYRSQRHYRNADNRFFGGDSEEATPVPIPNTEVKLFSADGTAREAVWESRTLPKTFFEQPVTR